MVDGLQVWVDSSGLALDAALQAGAQGIKVNWEEACAALELATRLRARVSQVVITLGALGAVYFGPLGKWHVPAPRVETVSSVGSGDAFFGAFLWAVERDGDAHVALQDGVAAGAVNAMYPGAGQFSRAQFEQLRAAPGWRLGG